MKNKAANLAILLVLGMVASAAVPAVKKGAHGAIAFNPATGAYGYAIDRATERQAKFDALNACGQPQCEVVTHFRGECGALANGPKRFIAAKGLVRQEAEAKALRLCGERCQIVVWACTR